MAWRNTYTVQILVVHEMRVPALDAIAAGKIALERLYPKHQLAAIALRVLDNEDGSGALAERPKGWRFAQEHFGAICDARSRT